MCDDKVSLNAFIQDIIADEILFLALLIIGYAAHWTQALIAWSGVSWLHWSLGDSFVKFYPVHGHGSMLEGPVWPLETKQHFGPDGPPLCHQVIDLSSEGSSIIRSYNGKK